MELVDLGSVLVGPDGTPSSGFGVFDNALAAGGRVKAIVAPGMAGITRREIDELTERARRFGAKGLAYLALEAGGEVKSPIAKFLSDETQRALIEATGAGEGDLILIVADTPEVTADVLGRLRVELGERLGLADPNVLSYVWINRFPMYQWDEELGRWHATHNPFSGVLPEDEALLVTASGDPAKPSPDDPAGRARALQYDLALNGWELGGGSIRIHRRELLERSFLLQGHSLEAMREKFGAVLDAFDYGAPPHGGIALGIDRWAALFAHQTNIREVMAFPKTQSGTDPMLEAPSIPEPGQYEELGLRFVGVPVKGDRGDRQLSGDRGDLGALDWFAQRPRLAALLGATCIAFSGVFYLFAAVSPSTGTFYRAVFGLPILVVVALAERRRFGPLPRDTIRLAAIAGVFFTGDLMFWHHAIEAVGAGLATVLGNLQVIIVGFFAWLLLGERPSRATLLALPIVLAGVILISGVVGSGAYGAAPQLGVVLGVATAICYSAYLLIIRRGGRDPRRPAGPVAVATVVVALCAFVVGEAFGDLDLAPPLHSLFWLALLGITAQSAGYLLISISLPRLPAIVTSIILLTQPVMSMGLAIVLLRETPSATQLLGVGLVVGGIAAATIPVARLRDRWQRARPSPLAD